MKTMKQLLEEKANVVAAATKLKEKAAAENRDFTEAEEKDFAECLGLLDVVNGDIKKAEQRKAQFERLESESRHTSESTVEEIAATSGLKERAQDDPKRGFKNLGDFANSVQNAMTPGTRSSDERLRILSSATGMSQGVGADGGFLTPPEFSTTIWDGMNKQPDNLLARTDNYTVTGESLTFPANAETSRATGSRYGGIRGYWMSEAAQMTASAPKFRQMKLEPQQLGVLVYVTDKLLNNAPALNAYLTRAASEEINFLVNDSIINGTGAGQPKGLLQSACRVTATKETNQAAKTITFNNIVKMFAQMHSRSRANAVWLINQDIEPQLFSLNAAIGGSGQLVYMPPGGISAAPYATLLGKPVLPIEYAATLGTEGDIMLVDLSAYASGTKGTVESASSIHLRFDYNETAFRFLFAVDGQPWLASPITPYKGSNTQSPFVTLAVRA
jgi:HK97 family phage major capsid protein